jgi:glutathione S-transferase
MTYTLYIGDRLFSSWSLRGWLMLEKFGLEYRTEMVGLYSGTMQKDLAHLSPARLVPVLKTPEDEIVGESLAIAETLAERHPDKGMWPSDPARRMRARWLCAEMASGFSALRTDCPMQLAHVNGGFHPSARVQEDVARLEEIWRAARRVSGSRDGWLFGDYTLADVFYAPVAARLIGYDLPVADDTRDYCLKTITDPSFQTWRQAGLQITYDPFPYPVYAPTRPWPGD